MLLVLGYAVGVAATRDHDCKATIYDLAVGDPPAPEPENDVSPPNTPRTVTTFWRGSFEEDAELRREFLQLSSMAVTGAGLTVWERVAEVLAVKSASPL